MRKNSGLGLGKEGLKKGKWSAYEDQVLKHYVKRHGPGNWGNVARETGLKRCGKSVRLRWMNYLRPDIKHGKITEDEEDIMLRMHKLVGKRWALIAGRIPGRTDNEIKNYWNSTLSKKLAEEKREDSEVCRNEIFKVNLSFPAVDDGHRNPNKCDEVTKEGEEGALMCFASNGILEDEHRCLGITSSGSITMNPNEGVDIGCVAYNDIQPTGKELNYKAMLWSDSIMELDGGQLDMSEFLQTDYSKFWEESDIFKSFEVGGCSTIHEWPNNLDD